MRIWSDPACDALLRRGIEQTLSFARIAGIFAEELGISITRSALIGRANRLHLAIPKPTKKADDTLSRRSRRIRLKPAAKIVKCAPAMIAPPEGVSLFDLCSEHCRFPNDDATMYCGQPRLEYSSYCEAHHRVCYVKPWR